LKVTQAENKENRPFCKSKEKCYDDKIAVELELTEIGCQDANWIHLFAEGLSEVECLESQ
jgi:hypothetical protein